MEIPETFGPERRDAVRHYELASAWSYRAIEGLAVNGIAIDSPTRLIDVLSRIDSPSLEVLNQELLRRLDAADAERELWKNELLGSSNAKLGAR